MATESVQPDRGHFVVEGWDVAGSDLTLRFSGGGRTFRETCRFPAPIPVDPGTSAVLDLLAVVAAVSYAKALSPCDVHAPGIALTLAGTALVESAFGEGMAEFAHHTGIAEPVRFARGQSRPDTPCDVGAGRPLVPLGGGRDSCLVATALGPLDPILLSVGGSDAARRVAATLGRELAVVERSIDPQILEMNSAGSPNGHIPITAITMLISAVAASGLGSPSVVMANEMSASNPTRIVEGRPVNHQHSKSDAFEMFLVGALASVGARVVCVSALRNKSDTDIARAFAQKCTSLHHDFVSCNRAGIKDPQRRSARWCAQCPKCRSIYLSLAPHMEPAALATIFGRDLLADEHEIPGFADLCHQERKPFECVQTVDEARAAVGVLAASSIWSGHSVVRALAHLGGPPVATHARRLGDHVPEEIRAAMEKFFS